MCKGVLAGVLFAAMFAAGPTRGEEPANASAYFLRGVYRGVDPATGQITVAHEEVRGFMPAMTMNFDLASPGETRGLQPGDTFTCRLRVTDNRAWLEAIHKEDVPAVSSFGAVMLASRSTELSVGDVLPDIELTGQRGEIVHLHDFGGKPLAISFIYLRCALPTYCPLLNHNFQAAQALLDHLGLPGQAHFLSVSMDPEHDTPSRLTEYAKAYGADPQTWTFATTRDDRLRRLGDAVGLEFQRQGDLINHNLRVVVADSQGRIRRTFRGNAWTPQELAAELRAAATAHD